jgi:hypothetical protein
MLKPPPSETPDAGGFRLEDTRMTDPGKISTLIGILSVAFAFAHAVGEWKHGILPVLIKSHGRRAFSFFRYGLETLRLREKDQVISWMGGGYSVETISNAK